jgi:hypothetical protein
MIKSFGGCIWILLSSGAKWRSKPKLKMIWIVRSSADGGAAPSRRSAGAAGAGVPFVTFEANRPRLP